MQRAEVLAKIGFVEEAEELVPLQKLLTLYFELIFRTPDLKSLSLAALRFHMVTPLSAPHLNRGQLEVCLAVHH